MAISDPSWEYPTRFLNFLPHLSHTLGGLRSLEVLAYKLYIKRYNSVRRL